MICPRCQKSVEDGARFCKNCGLSTGTVWSADQAQEKSPDSSSDKSSEPAPDRLLGQIIDSKYQVIEQLGKGGMGVVYRAERVLVGDEVALKVLHSEFVAEQETVERFRREARAAAKLRHPNVVSIYDYGEARGADAPAYIVMELLRGESLRTLLKREKRLEPTRAVQLMRGICSGIGLAHRRQIVHRDIKPDNIILLPPDEEEGRERETVKVVDFGIAKLRDAATSGTLTRKGFQPGTVYYMSPEQCRGDELDARSDVYSLGALLYEMLAGRPPFIAETQTGVMAKHLFDPPPQFPENLHIPPALEAVIMHALAKEADARPVDALAMGRELLEIEPQVVAAEQRAAGSETRSPASVEKSAHEIEKKSIAENESYSTSESVSSLTGSALPAPDTGETPSPQIETAVQQKIITSPTAQRQTGSIATDSASGARPTTKTRSASKIWIVLGGLIVAAAIAVVAFTLLNSKRTGESKQGSANSSKVSNVSNPSPSPGTVTPSYQPLGTPFKVTRDIFKVVLSPDSKTLLSTASLASPSAKSSINFLDIDGHSVAFSPDGKSLAVGQEDGSLILEDSATLAHKHEWHEDKDYVFIVAFTPDSQRLVSASADKMVRVWNAASGQQEHELQIGKGELIITLDASQMRVAIFDPANGQIRIRSINDPAATSSFDNRHATVSCGAFSPNGETLALGTSDGRVQLWSIPDGTFIRDYQGSTHGEVGSVAFTTDGQYLAIGWTGGDIELRRTSDGGTVQILKGHARVVHSLSLSSDGRTLASGAEDKTIRLWQY